MQVDALCDTRTSSSFCAGNLCRPYSGLSIARQKEILPWSALVLDAKPAMTFIVTAKCFCDNGVRKSKKGCVLAPCSFESEEAL